jgi:hypothetical protein
VAVSAIVDGGNDRIWFTAEGGGTAYVGHMATDGTSVQSSAAAGASIGPIVFDPVTSPGYAWFTTGSPARLAYVGHENPPISGGYYALGGVATGMAFNESGNQIYIAEKGANRVERCPSTGGGCTPTVFPTGPTCTGPNQIILGPQIGGVYKMWFTSDAGVCTLDPSDGTVAVAASIGLDPVVGIALGPDGNVWVSENSTVLGSAWVRRVVVNPLPDTSPILEFFVGLSATTLVNSANQFWVIDPSFGRVAKVTDWPWPGY